MSRPVSEDSRSRDGVEADLIATGRQQHGGLFVIEGEDFAGDAGLDREPVEMDEVGVDVVPGYG